MKKEFTEGVDYYLHNGMVVMTYAYHIKRGSCCGSKCKHCPYSPQYIKGNTKINLEKS